MQLNHEYFRAIIFYNFQCGLTQQQCIDEPNLIFDYEALSRTSIYRWYGEFNRRRSSLQDEFCEFVVQNQLLFRKPLMLCAN